MTPFQIQIILDDINRHTEGGGFEIDVLLSGGVWLCGCTVTNLVFDLIVLSRSDTPPTYVDAESIVAIHLGGI